MDESQNKTALVKKSAKKVFVGMSGGGARFAGTYLKLAHGLGASRLLTKPFMHTELMALIEELAPEEDLSSASLSPSLG